jgi:hypothetical protein
MAGDDELRIYVEELAQALQHNMPPPPIPADMPPGAISEIDMLLAGLGMAGNSGDPKDMANGQAGFAQRGDKTGEAMSKFPANDQDSSKQLEQLMSSATQMPQQFMQAFGGMFQGLSQGMNQAMQQGMQMGTQMASSLGKAGQGAGLAGELPADALGDALGAGGAALGAGGAAGGAGAGLADATVPAGNLGPPPVPSAGTYPAASQQVPVPPSAPDPGAGARGSMGGGMPMMPPGAAGGAGAGGSDSKAETKRVVPPTVKNGAPVQGRITSPQTTPEVVKRIVGKPIASRRMVAPDGKRDDDDEIDRNRS